MDGRIKPYECGRCGSSFGKHKELAQHVKIHAEDGTYECAMCKLFFINEDDYAQHKRAHKHPIRVAQFGCNICGECFPNVTVMKKHMASHEPASDTSNCDECEETFYTHDELMAHQMIHTSQSDLASMKISGKSLKNVETTKHISIVKANSNEFENNKTESSVVQSSAAGESLEEMEEIDDDLELMLLLMLDR